MKPYADTNLFTRAHLELPENTDADNLFCDHFWSFDPKAATLAALEGLKNLP